MATNMSFGSLFSRSAGWLWALGLIVLLSLTTFQSVLSPDAVLVTTDDNYGEIIHRKSKIPEAFTGWWGAGPVLGHSGVINVNLSYVILGVMSAEGFTNWIHAIHLGIASLFFFLFLRLRGVGTLAACFGLIVAFWTGTNLTLTYAGHLSKFGTLAFSMIALFAIEKAASSRKLGWSLVAGGALGYMFLEQQDLALFVGIFLGAYAVCRFWRPFFEDRMCVAKHFLVMGCLPMLIAGSSLLLVFNDATSGAPADLSLSTEQQAAKDRSQFDFATQWSVPPDEMIEFIAPGYMGWRSDDPSGMYWGRTGRSADWAPGQQGFRNFRLENTYLGIIPVAIALWGIFFLVLRRQAPAGVRSDVFIWSGMAVVALLLSFGRYFPLYSVFYELPGIGSIRNPNKFLHIFQIAIAVLAAFGMESIFGVWRASLSRPKEKRLIKLMFAGSLLGGVCMVMGAVSLSSSRDSARRIVADTTQSIQGGALAPAQVEQRVRQALASSPDTRVSTLARDGYSAGSIVATIGTSSTALGWGAGLLFFCLGAGYIAVFFAGGKAAELRRVLGCLVLLVTGVDAYLLGQHYIVTQGQSELVGSTDMTEFLKNRQGLGRTGMMVQQGIYNNWLTYLMPAQGITMFNFTQMPRMAPDYKEFLGQGAQSFSHQIRMMKVAGVTHLMMPSQVWNQITSQAAHTALGLESVYEYRYVKDLGGVVRAVPGTPMAPADHMIASVTGAQPRFSLHTHWSFVAENMSIKALFSPSYKIGEAALLIDSDRDKIPVNSAAGVPRVGSNVVTVESYSDSDFTLQTRGEEAAILVCADRFESGWKAVLDGVDVPILKANGLMRGVFIPAGTHQVRLVYEPIGAGLWLQAVGTLLAFFGVGMLVVSARRSRSDGTQDIPGAITDVAEKKS